MLRLRSVLGKVFKQQNMSPKLGGLINVYSTTGILYSPLSFLGIVTTVYGLWGGTIMRSIFPWFTTWHLMASLVVFGLIAMFFFFRFVLPSIFAFQVSQQYKHRNPLVADIQAIKEEQERAKERDKAIDKKMDSILEKITKLQSE